MPVRNTPVVALRRTTPAAPRNLPVYRHASGVHSNRMRERATDGSLTFRYAAANIHLAHNALATA